MLNNNKHNKQSLEATLLSVNNLSVKYPNNQGEDDILVNNVSFKVAKGEIFSIVGESGSGKSLTCYSVLSLLKHLGNFKVPGDVIFNGADISSYSEKQMQALRGADISMIFQDPMTSLNPLHKIGRQLHEAIYIHNKNLTKTELEQKILDVLTQVELEILHDRLDAFPHELSGGQKQRVMIAMALINNPKLIIADEPTTALDVTVQKEILNLLKKLRDENDLSIIFVSHDLTVVESISDKIAIMQQGKMVEQGNSRDIFKAPKHSYTKKLLAAQPDGKPVKYNPKDATEVLEAKDYAVKYQLGKGFFSLKKNYFTAVKDVAFKLNKGQSIGIVGESGSGKSSIAKAIVKLAESDGILEVDNKNIANLTPSQYQSYRKKIQMVFQDPYSSLNPRMMVRDIIAEGYEENFPKITEIELNKKIIDILAIMGLPSYYISRYPHQLSGGQKQRVSIARSLILEPEILILDEPTSALDIITEGEIVALLKKIQREKQISYIFISHDLRTVKSICHYIIVLKDGAVIEQAESATIFNSPKSSYTTNLFESAFLNEKSA